MEKEFQERILKNTFKHCQKVEKFCEPLKTHLGIDYFFYYRMTKCGHYSFISNDPNFNEFVFENKKNYLHWPYIRDYTFFQREMRFFNPENSALSTVLNLARDKFNLNLFLQILEKNISYVEGFCFGTKQDKNLVSQKCVSDFNLLKLFTQQFKKNFEVQVKDMENNQINMKEVIGSEFYNNLLNDFEREKSRNDFLSKMGCANYKELTKREIEIMDFLVKGYSGADIAKQIYLSKRTVEKHIENMKDKLNCYTRFELIDRGRPLIQI